jgi:hypothetical protein
MWIPALNFKDKERESLNSMFIIFSIFLIFFMGLRHDVGGDWENYINQFENTFEHTYSYVKMLYHDDPGFWILGYFMYSIEWNIYGVDFIVAIIFMIGLAKLLKQQPNPWLGLAVAFPYLIIVVSMGYVRQAAAIGFIMWGISYLREKSFSKFIMMVFFATIFHKTAILLVGIGMFQEGRGKFFRLIALIFIGSAMWSAFLAQDQSAFIKNYVDSQMYSGGAIIRIVMNVVPALILFYTRKRWQEIFDDYHFWKIIAFSSIIMLLLLSIASTAVDRMALYFIPIQIVVFSRLPLLLEGKVHRQQLKFTILLYYLFVMSIWLNIGTFSRLWIPYHNIIFYNTF